MIDSITAFAGYEACAGAIVYPHGQITRWESGKVLQTWGQFVLRGYPVCGAVG